MKSLITGLGRFALFLASAAFLTVLSVFVLGAYALTWPVFRLSPRDARVSSVMGLAAAGMAVMRAYTPEKPGEAPEDPSDGTGVPDVTELPTDSPDNPGAIIWQGREFVPLRLDEGPPYLGHD